MPNQEIGGEGVIVQIDESVISKKKYGRGKKVRATRIEKWVLGMYDTAQKVGIVLYVVRRNKATMVPLIQTHVKQGSIIWTDQWAAYKGLHKLGYTHCTVNHSRKFKSAEWDLHKRSRRVLGSSKRIFAAYKCVAKCFVT